MMDEHIIEIDQIEDGHVVLVIPSLRLIVMGRTLEEARAWARSAVGSRGLLASQRAQPSAGADAIAADGLRTALMELLRKAELEDDVDFLREGVRLMAQQLMETEVAQNVGADKYERTAARSGERNGYRDRSWDTRVGSIELRVPAGTRPWLLPSAARAASPR